MTQKDKIIVLGPSIKVNMSMSPEMNQMNLSLMMLNLRLATNTENLHGPTKYI